MLGIALLVILALWLAFLYPIIQRRPAEVPKSDRYNLQMKKLWNAAQTSMREHKPLRAEKALLTILKFDEKNAAAYNRLGIPLNVLKSPSPWITTPPLSTTSV